MSVPEPALVKKYFVEDSESWIKDGYEDDGYNYPVGLARMRRVLAVMRERFPNGGAHVADLGCGGGQVTLTLAANGYEAIGIDQSSPMIQSSTRIAATADAKTRARVRFVEASLERTPLGPESMDAAVSMGVIGYLPEDEILFKEAARILRPGGLLIVSCRNRLFNMVSISDYTLREIQSGGAAELVHEIKELMQKVPPQEAAAFAKALAEASSDAAAQTLEYTPAKPAAAYKFSIEARQHTPRQLQREAERCGFQTQATYGVHPHLLMAALNRSLPRGFYNRLSSSLDCWGHLPVSLIWSSVFIGVFRKN